MNLYVFHIFPIKKKVTSEQNNITCGRIQLYKGADFVPVDSEITVFMKSKFWHILLVALQKT